MLARQDCCLERGLEPSSSQSRLLHPVLVIISLLLFKGGDINLFPGPGRVLGQCAPTQPLSQLIALAKQPFTRPTKKALWNRRSRRPVRAHVSTTVSITKQESTVLSVPFSLLTVLLSPNVRLRAGPFNH